MGLDGLTQEGEMKEEFTLDGQLHIPTYRVEETLETAIKRGLNAVIFTDYGTTNPYDALRLNKDDEGYAVLDPTRWDHSDISQITMKVSCDKGDIYVIKGEEVKTKQGHLLIWGIKEAIENGVDIEEALKRTYQQGGVAVFSHLVTRLFHGCGEKLFREMYKKFNGQPLGVEQNGQITSRWISDNEKVERIARRYNVSCFGTSDIHGRYREEHKKIGLRNYTSIDSSLIDSGFIIESLSEIMLFSPEKIKVGGDTNSLTETFLWNLSSLRQNGFRKVLDLFDGLKHIYKTN